MSGLHGYVAAYIPAGERERCVRRMLTVRGPSDSTPKSFGDATFATTDTATEIQSTGDGRFVAALDGTLFNVQELKGELLSLGARIRGATAAEVLAVGFATWGGGILHRMRGSFAFAIWDLRERQLFLARDEFGVKTLHYSRHHAAITFSSDLRALCASGTFPVEVDPRAVSDCLTHLAPPAPRTLYRDVYTLRPGEFLTVQGEETTRSAYWTFQEIASRGAPTVTSRERFVSELRTRVRQAIRVRASQHETIGIHLDGCLESTAMAALASQESRTAIRTFSFEFPEIDLSRNLGRAIAQHLSLPHECRVLTGPEVARDLPALLEKVDQPGTHILEAHYVGEMLQAAGATVHLSSHGGSAATGLRSWFEAEEEREAIPHHKSKYPEWIRRLMPFRAEQKPVASRKLASLLEQGGSFHEVAALRSRNFPENLRRRILAPEIPFTPHDELPFLAREIPPDDARAVAAAWQLRTHLPDTTLRDVDRASRAIRRDTHLPFLDRHAIEWIWAQPAALRHPGPLSRPLLVELIGSTLPAHLIPDHERVRRWPLSEWMRGAFRPFLDETFSPASIARTGFFRTEAVHALWVEFLRATPPMDGNRLWSLAILINVLNRKP